MLGQQLSRKTLKALNPRNAGDFTFEGTCIQDLHDKSKPYRFSIHEGIDGFSRRILWLENSTSEILAKYYLDAVKQHSMLVNVKVDDGTGYSLVQTIQSFFKLQTVVIQYYTRLVLSAYLRIDELWLFSRF